MYVRLLMLLLLAALLAVREPGFAFGECGLILLLVGILVLEQRRLQPRAEATHADPVSSDSR